MSMTAAVRDTGIAIRDKLRDNIRPTKVKRYWPGKAPEWADDAEQEVDIRTARAVAPDKAFPTKEDSEVIGKDDPRLRHLAKMDNKEEVRANHRCIKQTKIVSTLEEEKKNQEKLDVEEEDENALEERRRRIREKNLPRQTEEAACNYKKMNAVCDPTFLNL